MNTSALRYYEERGLVCPTRRSGGRMYTVDELRRLAFVQVMQRLGIGLGGAAAVLEASAFLQHAPDCPAEHPVQECPYLRETLDGRLAGVALEELAADRS